MVRSSCEVLAEISLVVRQHLDAGLGLFDAGRFLLLGRGGDLGGRGGHLDAGLLHVVEQAAQVVEHARPGLRQAADGVVAAHRRRCRSGRRARPSRPRPSSASTLARSTLVAASSLAWLSWMAWAMRLNSVRHLAQFVARQHLGARADCSPAAMLARGLASGCSAGARAARTSREPIRTASSTHTGAAARQQPGHRSAAARSIPRCAGPAGGFPRPRCRPAARACRPWCAAPFEHVRRRWPPAGTRPPCLFSSRRFDLGIDRPCPSSRRAGVERRRRSCCAGLSTVSARRRTWARAMASSLADGRDQGLVARQHEAARGALHLQHGGGDLVGLQQHFEGVAVPPVRLRQPGEIVVGRTSKNRRTATMAASAKVILVLMLRSLNMGSPHGILIVVNVPFCRMKLGAN